MDWNALSVMYAREPSMADVPAESRNKYGNWSDDDAELTAVLNGNPLAKRPAGGAAIPPPEDDDEIDATTLLKRVNSVDKYGR